MKEKVEGFDEKQKEALSQQEHRLTKELAQKHQHEMQLKTKDLFLNNYLPVYALRTNKARAQLYDTR